MAKLNDFLAKSFHVCCLFCVTSAAGENQTLVELNIVIPAIAGRQVLLFLLFLCFFPLLGLFLVLLLKG